jgi:hypothetical protein
MTADHFGILPWVVAGLVRAVRGYGSTIKAMHGIPR